MRLPRNEGLNIIPLIDIMLVLLCIVLSISTFIANGRINIKLPLANNSSKNFQQKSFTISVDKDNNTYFNEKNVSKELLKDKLLSLNNSDFVEIKSDRESKFELFIYIIDILKEKNHENFSIITEK